MEVLRIIAAVVLFVVAVVLALRTLQSGADGGYRSVDG